MVMNDVGIKETRMKKTVCERIIVYVCVYVIERESERESESVCVSVQEKDLITITDFAILGSVGVVQSDRERDRGQSTRER